MKTNCFLVGFGLVSQACEEEDDVTIHDEVNRNFATMQTDGLIVPTQNEIQSVRELELISSADSLCPTVNTSQTVIDLNALASFDDGEIVVRKNVSSQDHLMMATAYTNGDEAIVEQYSWSIQDTDLARFSSMAWDNNTIEIETKRDLFDRDGSEPTSTAVVCAMGACNVTLGCETFSIMSILDLDGDWIVQGNDDSPPLDVHFAQSGRTILIEPTFGETLVGELTQNTLTFSDHHLLYTCTFTDPTHGNGTVIDIQKNQVIETWTVDKP